MKTCCVCGTEYKPFALDSYEMQIKGAEDMCKDCLQALVDEMIEEDYDCE